MITFTLVKNCGMLINSFDAEIVTEKVQFGFKDRNDVFVDDDYTAVLVKENGTEVYYPLHEGKCEIPANKMLGTTKICLLKGNDSYSSNELLCKQFEGVYSVSKCVKGCNDEIKFYMQAYDKLTDKVKTIEKEIETIKSRVEDLEGYDL